jgi:hypothetical protein
MRDTAEMDGRAQAINAGQRIFLRQMHPAVLAAHHRHQCITLG